MSKLFALIILLTLLSCKKRENAINWDISMSAPIAKGELFIYDILPDSVLTTESDSSVSINFDMNLYTLNIDSLIEIPDTSLLDTFALPFPVPINFSPGQTFINEPEENNIDAAGAELTLVRVKEGSINYTLTSTIEGDIIYEYLIPTAINSSGIPFSQEVPVPAASSGSKSSVSGSFDLSGYTIDLTGLSGGSFNKIQTTINVVVDPANGSDITASDQDTIQIENILKDIRIDYARGYFGNQNFTFSESNELDAFDQITEGTIDIDQINIDFTISNGAGVDGQFVLSQISSVNDNGNAYDLAHSLIGSAQNINRAYESGSEIIPYYYSQEFNNTNSNIDVLLENQPDQLDITADFQLNPLGNVSAHNDFISSDYPIKVDLGIDLPLSAIASDLIIVDTISIDVSDTISLRSGHLYIDIENGFPINADLDVILLDQNNMVIDHLFAPDEIPAGNINDDNKVISYSNSSHEIELGELSMQKLIKNKKLVLVYTFNTATVDHVNIYDYNSLRFKIKSDFTYGITIR